MPPKKKLPVKVVAEATSQTPKKRKRQTEQPEKKATEIKEPIEIEKPEKKTRKAAEKTDKATKTSKKSKKAESNEPEEKSIPQSTRSTTKTDKRATATKKEDKAPLQNQTETKWDEIDFGCPRKNAKGQKHNFKISSWNVDGIRAWLKKGGLNIFKYDKPDILCLQETKCNENQLPDDITQIEGYHDYWCSSKKDGYAGVALFTKQKPLDVKQGIEDKDQDDDGRCLTAEYPDFYLVCVYVPNAGRGLVTLPKRLKWNESFKTYIKQLDSKKPVIICGDMNVAHQEIDLANPKTNKRNAGFTIEEREGMSDFLEEGYVDSFRSLYPDKKEVYTFWTYMSKARIRNIGWRLDYFILSKRLMDNVCDIVVQSQVYGSDHCPLSLFITI